MAHFALKCNKPNYACLPAYAMVVVSCHVAKCDVFVTYEHERVCVCTSPFTNTYAYANMRRSLYLCLNTVCVPWTNMRAFNHAACVPCIIEDMHSHHARNANWCCCPSPTRAHACILDSPETITHDPGSSNQCSKQRRHIGARAPAGVAGLALARHEGHSHEERHSVWHAIFDGKLERAGSDPARDKRCTGCERERADCSVGRP
jgi:hypothetical protein